MPPRNRLYFSDGKPIVLQKSKQKEKKNMRILCSLIKDQTTGKQENS